MEYSSSYIDYHSPSPFFIVHRSINLRPYHQLTILQCYPISTREGLGLWRKKKKKKTQMRTKMIPETISYIMPLKYEPLVVRDIKQ